MITLTALRPFTLGNNTTDYARETITINSANITKLENSPKGCKLIMNDNTEILVEETKIEVEIIIKNK